MGKAKRRKTLNPGYKKIDLVGILSRKRSSIFNNQVLGDYLRYRAKIENLQKLQDSEDIEIIQSFKIASKVLGYGQDVLLPAIDEYMDVLDEGLKNEFAVFVNYVLGGTTGGSLIIRWLRTNLKRGVTGKDLTTIFPYLYVSAIKPDVLTTNTLIPVQTSPPGQPV